MTMAPDTTAVRAPDSRQLVRDFFIFYNASLVFFAIGVITSLGLNWYGTLSVPAWSPPVLIIAAVWGALFLTTAISLVIYCDTTRADASSLRRTVTLYIVNAFLILLWNYLFFGIHELVLAVWAAVAVGVSVLALIWRVRKASTTAAWLLAPYIAWMLYAVAINYSVMLMN